MFQKNKVFSVLEISFPWNCCIEDKSQLSDKTTQRKLPSLPETGRILTVFKYRLPCLTKTRVNVDQVLSKSWMTGTRRS